MSLVLSNTNTSGVNGIIQMIENEIGMQAGGISGDTGLMKIIISDINEALDIYTRIAIQASGKWQFDDSNQSDYPIITTNLVSGQRDYSFTVDGSSNLILDIYKVAILPTATSTLYQSISPIDEIASDTNILTGNTNGGVPFGYGKLGNGIFLEPRPNYNATNGIKLFINRESSYFTTSNTTKKPGVPGIHHNYFYLRPAMNYARRNSLSSYTQLRDEVLKLEGDENQGLQGEIARYFSRRDKDDRPVFYNEPIIFQ